MNVCIFVGRLTKTPELKQMTDGTAICEFNIAVNRHNNGADYPRLKAYGKDAENLAKYKKQGDLLAVQCHLKTGSYEKDNKTIFTNDFIIDRIKYLTAGNNENNPTPNAEYFGGYDF